MTENLKDIEREIASLEAKKNAQLVAKQVVDKRKIHTGKTLLLKGKEEKRIVKQSVESRK